MRSLQHEIADSRNQIVWKLMGKDVTRGELSDAFDRVANKQHWKREIDTVVTVSGDSDLLLILYAVEFFTGSKPTEQLVGSDGPAGPYRYCIKAAGYFATCGA